MRNLAAETSKKATGGRLRKNGEHKRERILNRHGVREKLRLQLKGLKPEPRKKWKEHLANRQTEDENWDTLFWEKTDQEDRGWRG